MYPHTRSSFRRRPLLLGTVILLAAAIAAYSVYGGGHTGQSADADGQQQAMPVDVVVLQPESLRLWNDFSGRLSAVDQVEVRPRVGGTITQILFEEGAIVEKDAPLFVIDPRPYEATLARARADQQAAQSQVNVAKQELGRAKKLVEDNVISESRFDITKGAYNVAIANVQSARAAKTQAELDVEYANIKAPIGGRVSRAEITIGNVIQAGQNAPVLTTIVANDTLYAEFDVDEQTYLKTVRSSQGKGMPVKMTLAGDESVVYDGIIHSFDNRLNANSGTIRARAVFKNTDGVLVPGMYANIQLGAASETPTLMVSEKAIGTDQDKRFVYIVDADSTVAYREVNFGRSVDGKRVILSGLTAGDRIIINGIQKVRPGMAVKPVTAAERQANAEAHPAPQ